MGWERDGGVGDVWGRQQQAEMFVMSDGQRNWTREGNSQDDHSTPPDSS